MNLYLSKCKSSSWLFRIDYLERVENDSPTQF